MTHSVSIAPATRPGAVHLTIADIDRSLRYYTRAIGLEQRGREDGRVALGTGSEDLLVLHEQPGAVPVQGHTGLFHFALLLPERVDLARWLAHAAQDGVAMTGASDHGVSEALYLRDPDGHGIEIYRDRPRDQWPMNDDGTVGMFSIPIDLDELLAARGGDHAPFERMPAGTVMGHVHLHVANVPETEEFYAGVLGFDVTAHLADQATFFSAGGYHHHLAGNTWAGQGATPPPAGSAAMRYATIVLPDAAERERVAGRVADSGQHPQAVDGGLLVRDPSANALLLVA